MGWGQFVHTHRRRDNQNPNDCITCLADGHRWPGAFRLGTTQHVGILRLWKVMKQLYLLVSNNISLRMKPSKWFRYIMRLHKSYNIYKYRSWIWQWDDIQDGNFLWGLDRRIARWTAFATREAILRQSLGSFVEEKDVKRWQNLD